MECSTHLPMVPRESSSAKSHNSGLPFRGPTSQPQKRQRLPGGWSATGSDHCARIARARGANLQKSVVRLIHDRTTTDPLGESETTRDYLEYLQECGVEKEETTRCMPLLEKWKCSEVRKLVLELETVEQLAEVVHLVPDVDDQIPTYSRTANKQKLDDLREEGGENPREIRARLRKHLYAGSYLSITNKSDFRGLYRFGSCYAVLGVDFVRYSYLGVVMPRRKAYDKICKNCAKKNPLTILTIQTAPTHLSSSSALDDQDRSHSLHGKISFRVEERQASLVGRL